MQTRFKFKEGLMTALGIKNQMVKMSLMLVSGALVWSSGGIQEVKAQVCGDGGMIIPNPDGPGISCSGGSYGLRPYGSHPYDGYGPPPLVNTGSNTPPPPVIQKPSSYGAVAWNLKKGSYGSASKQASKQAAIDLAMQRCGDASCEVATWYANQCVAVSYGVQSNKKYLWQSSLGLTKAKAERQALKDCAADAKNCKILLSECSLP